MDNEPLVHVIVCTYNSASTLDESILSIINQTYQNMRLIIVDDGSTDTTADILKKLKKSDQRIHSIRKENSGLGPSRNIAIEYAITEDAEFYAFCDADDVWTPNKLKLQMQLFHDRPDADIVVTDMITYDSPILEEETTLKYTHLSNIFKMLCLENFSFQPVTAVVRATLFNNIARYTTDKSGQDFYPFLHFAFEGFQYYKIKTPLYRERQLQGSLQRSPNSAYLGGRARRSAIEKLQKDLSTSPNMTDENIVLLNQAFDKYCSWMLSGARKTMPYREQLTLAYNEFPKFHNKKIAFREVVKSISYPLIFKATN